VKIPVFEENTVYLKLERASIKRMSNRGATPQDASMRACPLEVHDSRACL
jgi:hypothetical protein